MPYIATHTGQTVSPTDVLDNTRVTCVCCGADMGVKAAHFRDGNRVPRHFYHVANEDAQSKCVLTRDSLAGDSVPESAAHKWMKAVAYKAMAARFGQSHVEYEQAIGDRFADVCVTFPTPRHPSGRGIAIEAQYKHTDKNKHRVEREYLSHRYSTYWMYLSDVSDGGVFAFQNARFTPVWPHAVPVPREWTGQSLGQQELTEARPDMVRVPVQLRYEWERPHVDHAFVRPAASSVQVLGKGWLHSKGRQTAWASVFPAPDQAVVFGLVTRHRGETDSLGVVVAPDALVTMLQDFVDQLHTNKHMLFTDVSDTTPIAQVSFPKTVYGTGSLAVVVSPTDRVIRLERVFADGQRETFDISWRNGDDHRFEDNVLMMTARVQNHPAHAPHYVGSA